MSFFCHVHGKEKKIPFSEKIIMLKELEETYFLIENTIEFLTYESNIIKGLYVLVRV